MSESHELEIEITTDRRRINVDDVHRELATNTYWAVGMPRELVEKAISGSLCFAALHDDQLIGFGRVVTDYATFGYLSDFFVVSEFRGRGVSKKLVEAVVTHPDLQGFRRLALVTKDAHGLYKQFGWKVTETPEQWMERK